MHAQRIHRMIKLGLGIDEADEDVSCISNKINIVPMALILFPNQKGNFFLQLFPLINPFYPGRLRMLRMTARCHHWRGLNKIQAGWKR